MKSETDVSCLALGGVTTSGPVCPGVQKPLQLWEFHEAMEFSPRVLSTDLLEALKQNCLSEPNQFSQEPLKQLLLIILSSLTSGNSGYHQS